MSRVNLNVSYSEKDEAKDLGAKWDPKNKTWYVPDGMDPKRFSKWLEMVPERQGIRLIPPIYLIISQSDCWKCDRLSSVVTISAETFEDEDGTRPEKDLYLFSNIEYLPSEILAIVKRISPLYRKRFSRTAGMSYYMNHCPCGAPFGDFFLHGEPDSAFFPTSAAACKNIAMIRLPTPKNLRLIGDSGSAYPNLILEYAPRKQLNEG